MFGGNIKICYQMTDFFIIISSLCMNVIK